LRGWGLLKKCLRGMIPSLGLIFLVLGTIFLGLATPSEAGAMGVVGAIALAASYGTLTWKLLYQGMGTTIRLTAKVVFILIGARVFSLVFQGVGGKEWIEHWLTSLPGGQVGFLIFVNLFIFVIAFFLDFFEIAFIIIPMLAPAAEKLGIDLIWFGVLIGAIPWVVLQVMLVVILIAWPQTVTFLLDKPPVVDERKIEEQLRNLPDFA